mgnify:CR=1 FL=1
MKYLLAERWFSKSDVQDFTKRWWDIKDDTGMSDVKKRNAFDDLYDEATTEFFGQGTVKGDAKLIEFMRNQWLKSGFELADGSNVAMTAADVFVSNARENNNGDNVTKIVDLMVNRIPKLATKISKNETVQKLLSNNKDLYSYPMDDVAKAVGIFVNNTDLVATDEQPFFVDTPTEKLDGELTNIRMWDSGVKEARNIRGEKSSDEEDNELSDDSSEQDVIDILKDRGFDFTKKSNIDKLSNIVQKAEKALK